MLRTLFSLLIRQLFYFQSFANSCRALFHKSENQALCFHARAHDFVDMWGVCKNLENLKWHFCFASHQPNSAVHSTAVVARASSRVMNGIDGLPQAAERAARILKEPQWS
jgi:hypothetical protein